MTTSIQHFQAKLKIQLTDQRLTGIVSTKLIINYNMPLSSWITVSSVSTLLAAGCLYSLR